MTSPIPRKSRVASAALWAGLGLSLVPAGFETIRADEPPTKAKAASGVEPGRFFVVDQPIDSGMNESTQAAVDSYIRDCAARGERPVLIFEFRPGVTTSFGASFDLADFLSHKPKTVAYVPEPLSGYAVLGVLACDEIVMGKGASLGPITPVGKTVKAAHIDIVKDLAKRKERDPDLFLGMLDPNADLREIQTADRNRRFVLKSNRAEFEKTHKIIDDQPAWEAGRLGVLDGERARRLGLSKLSVESRAEIAAAYHLPAGLDPTLTEEIKPVWIEIEGPIDGVKESYLRRRLARASQDRMNLLLLRMNSPGGDEVAAAAIADAIENLKGMKTVAFIDESAVGVAALPALACDEIVFSKKGRMGDVRYSFSGGEGQGRELDRNQIEALSAGAEELAKRKNRPAAVARAMIDPAVIVVEARDAHTGAVVLASREQVQADPARYAEQGVVKDAGSVLEIKAEDAVKLRIASRVVEDEKGFLALFGLKERQIRRDGPTWVDALVEYLNNRWMSGLLLFIGMFMLILELKLPGLGLPGILAVLSFLLFFWSRYLSGTADQLEIMLFVVGMVCLGLELFVFPGFGVFGMSGVVLVLVSVVMASHTFVWPSRPSEYREMGMTLAQLTGTIVLVGAAAAILGRYFPSLPFFNRIVLKPEPINRTEDSSGKTAAEIDSPLAYLIGETGRTTTALRPTGKARFGDELFEVTADRFYIEPGTPVEVVEVHGPRIIVRRV